MSNDKEKILKHYREISDEVFLTIKPDDLTDEGKAAYYEEKIRRELSLDYQMKKKDSNVEQDTSNKMQPYISWQIISAFWMDLCDSCSINVSCCYLLITKI